MVNVECLFSIYDKKSYCEQYRREGEAQEISSPSDFRYFPWNELPEHGGEYSAECQILEKSFPRKSVMVFTRFPIAQIPEKNPRCTYGKRGS